MELFTPGHLIPLLIVAGLLFFGWKQLPDMARSVGRSLRIFKTEMKGMTEDDKARAQAAAPPPAVAAPPVVAPPLPSPPVEPTPAPAERPSPPASTAPTSTAPTSTAPRSTAPTSTAASTNGLVAAPAQPSRADAADTSHLRAR
jgi:sec-independent protein translocase protein TatA